MKIAVLVSAVVAAGIGCAPPAQADTGDQASAEQAVTAIYNRVIPGCTEHHNVGNIQSISWSRFYPASGGEGRIKDANSSLGGPFQAYYTNPRVGPAVNSPPFRAYGQWGVNLQFC
ncbi:hypothetical protein A5791_12020 [Mycobacterium sp. 852002-51163_SCH5372311]|uniref:hypothetical protein n=1 Tax=Mycobacterium sp. 852002-51163_SCH5372311 TaxID=1834097 RepID=UPI0007FDA6E7|nr:hypothetical protein [Mycobacterium sp. 852002-51163_SCH5372311]OBF78860.1 hypothetical protein A5791_12020 [Mycobacterium sp. 852002-51163_SCH5372311]